MKSIRSMFGARRVHTGRPGSRKGFSLVETLIATTMFAGVGYVLSLSMQASDQSFDTVVNSSEGNRNLRELTAVMVDELKAAQRATVLLTSSGGHSQLQFQTAIAGNGITPSWGAYDRDLNIDESLCSKDGWSIRYRVDTANNGTKSLVRTILNLNGAVQNSKTLATNVTQFSVTESGDVWVVNLTTEGKEGKRNEEFDVRTRDK